MRSQLLFVLCMFLFITNTKAQMADSLKAQYIKDWQRAKAYTKEYLDAMPKDKYSFRAQDSVRTFAQQMLHMAQGTVGLTSNGTGAQRLQWASRNLERSEGAQSADSVIYFVMASYDYAIESITNMDANKLFERFGRGNFNEMRITWLNKAFEHQTHHRGQTTIYIRLIGIKPPNEKLF
jgi:uncharacterized damage-inducible protein DinB